MSDPQRPHGLQPTRLLCPWDFPGKSTGVGCHCLLRPPSLELVNALGHQHSPEGVSITRFTLSYCSSLRSPLVFLLPENMLLKPSLSPLCRLHPDHCFHIRCSVLCSAFSRLSVINLCLLNMPPHPIPLPAPLAPQTLSESISAPDFGKSIVCCCCC